MNASYFVSLRYLYARRKQIFLSIISIISILGVALGVGALVITLSVMNGFQTDLKTKILASTPHITVLSKFENSIQDYKNLEENLTKIKEIKATAPFVYGQGMLRYNKISSGIVVKGISNKENAVTEIEKYLIQGSMPNTAQKEIILGRELARTLGVFVGDEVIFISPNISFSALGQLPRWDKLKVVGILETGMYEYDANIAYVDIKLAQTLFDLKNNVTGIGIKIDNAYKAEEISKIIDNNFRRNYFARSWLMTNRSLFAALKLEKFIMFIILVLIIIVAAFGIISSLILMTIEKTRDIGILKAMGMSRKMIAKIFVFQGMAIGTIGTVLGMAFGLGIVWLLKTHDFINLPADIYHLSKLPVDIEIFDIITICISAFIITILSTLFPAYKSAKLDPSVAVRYE